MFDADAAIHLVLKDVRATAWKESIGLGVVVRHWHEALFGLLLLVVWGHDWLWHHEGWAASFLLLKLLFVALLETLVWLVLTLNHLHQLLGVVGNGVDVEAVHLNHLHQQVFEL